MNEEIKHYGVAGMKLGIRRARMQQAKDAYKQAKSKAVNSEQMKKAKSEYKKQNLTNQMMLK